MVYINEADKVIINSNNYINNNNDFVFIDNIIDDATK